MASPEVPFPQTDMLTVEGLEKPVAPVYPVAVYSHQEGDAIGSGFVYRGKRMPQMVGKYIFTDITTGRVFYADLNEMIASQSVRGKQAAIHEIQVMYKNPYDAAEKAPVKRRMYDIVADTFAHKDGVADPVTHKGVFAREVPRPRAVGEAKRFSCRARTIPTVLPYGGGRADVRLSMGGDGELYLMSKSDGMISNPGVRWLRLHRHVFGFKISFGLGACRIGFSRGSCEFLRALCVKDFSD